MDEFDCAMKKVIEREVVAANLDGAEWRRRLKESQDLARSAEAARRTKRDEQRNAEETIAKQKAELERLREEAASRAANRRMRSSRPNLDVSSNLPARLRAAAVDGR